MKHRFMISSVFVLHFGTVPALEPALTVPALAMVPALVTASVMALVTALVRASITASVIALVTAAVKASVTVLK